jgi:O-antigen ligase
MTLKFSNSNNNPAADAANLLLRIALILLCIIVPSFAFVSRRVVLVIVPVALTMIVIANTVISEDFSVVQRLKNILSRITGLAAFTLVTWSLFSLSWSPYPEEASERLLKALGTIILGFAACLSLPQHMRAPNLHIITLGAIAAALMSVAVTASIYLGYRPVSPQGPTIARAAIMLALFVWPAIAWLKTRAAIWQAVALLTLVFLAILLSGSQFALITFAVGLVIFIFATLWLKATAWLLAFSVIISILGAPLLAFIAKNYAVQLENYIFIVSNSTFTSLKAWGELIAIDPLHFLTGYGFESAAKARSSGILFTSSILNIIIDLWYDLGLIGAGAVTALLASLIVRCLNVSHTITASLMAEISAICIFIAASNIITQVWFITSLAVVSVAFMAVKNGQHRTVRPKPVHH